VASREKSLCIDKGTENREMKKLTDAHFELSDATRTKVKLAVQVLSHSVSAGINTLVALKLMEMEALQTL